MTQDTIESIRQRMNDLDLLISATKKRLPAHSTKPPVMMELLTLEDEYDTLLEKLNSLKAGY